MAGDWMKIEKATPEKPEVFAIAAELDADPDLVFGKCFKIWRWFDDHTTNGKANAGSVTLALVDRLCGVTGFANAMLKVGWLQNDNGEIGIPNFDRHNGQTSKQRALTAKRVSNHKAKSNAPSVTKVTPDALPREEKRREENNTLSLTLTDGIHELTGRWQVPTLAKALRSWIGHIHAQHKPFGRIHLEALLMHHAQAGWTAERLERGINLSLSKATQTTILDPDEPKATNGSGRHQKPAKDYTP